MADKKETTLKHRGKNFHILQPGERLLKDGSWVTARGAKGKGKCIDPIKAESLSSRGKAPAKKKKGSGAASEPQGGE